MREMKDSDVEWIGIMPKHWTIMPVKYFFDINRGRVISVFDLVEDGLYPVYSSQTENEGCFGYLNTYDYSGPAITWTTDGAKAGTVFQRDGKYNCTNVCGILQVKKHYVNDVNLTFLTFAISMVAEQNKRYDINGFKIMSNEMANIRFAVPPLNEQNAIADYLDRKCAEIDTLTADIETQIETLEQYKRSVITEAVTKGLDPGAEMKDSGVEWIGRVPIDWDVSRLKYVCSMQSGDNITSQNILEEGSYKVFGGNGMRGYYYMFNTTGECILIGRQGALAGNVHYVNEKIWATDHAVVTRAGCAILTKFLLYVLDAMNLNQYAFDTAAQPGLAVNKIMNLSIPLPSLDSQHQIASFLERRCNSIYDAIDDKKNQLETLTEYKKSLIYEYVTGKKEVPSA